MELLSCQQYVKNMVTVIFNVSVPVLQLQIVSHRNFDVLDVTSLQSFFIMALTECRRDCLKYGVTNLEQLPYFPNDLNMRLPMPCNFQGQYTVFCYSTKTVTLEKKSECVIHIAL
jgi:hypothetical protein